LIVAPFIALLKVALIIAVFGQIGLAEFGGVWEITVGGVRGSPGLPVLVSGSLHPAIATAIKSAEIKILLNFCLRISFSPSNRCPGDKQYLRITSKQQTSAMIRFDLSNR
jgi:hypothetical protein